MGGQGSGQRCGGVGRWEWAEKWVGEWYMCVVRLGRVDTTLTD